MTEHYRISVSILSYNSIETLNKLLKRVAQQTYPIDSVVLVDNNTPDTEWSKLQLPDLPIQVLKNKRNLGVGAGHNMGWKKLLESETDFIWSLEHDCIPERECLQRLIDAYDTHSLKYQIGVVEPVEIANLDETGKKSYRLRGLGIHPVKKYKKLSEPVKGFGISFNGALFNAFMIREIGFLREEFFIGLEDSDYSQRINRAKYSVIKVPSAIVDHDLGKGARNLKLLNFNLLVSRVSPARKYYVMRNSLFMSLNNLYLASKRNKYGLIKFYMRFPFATLLDLFKGKKGIKHISARICAVRDAKSGQMGHRSYWFMQ